MILPFTPVLKDEQYEKMVDENDNNEAEEAKQESSKPKVAEVIKEKIDASCINPKKSCLNPKKCCVLQTPCAQKIVEAVKTKFT